MAQNNIKVPILCENSHCRNFGNIVNIVSEISMEDIDLFYEGYDGSVDQDYCPVCGELGIAEDPILY
ncbi:MAG: hypothetical protein IT314_07055 [Anaerolineales bacterium]|nr:hypothetical protein [Anaerolineales bacterium]